MKYPSLIGLFAVLFASQTAGANPPVASYIFPAGGQRGTTVNVRVGGLFLYSKCGFEMLGTGVQAPASLQRTKTVWFEGSLLPLPDSQRQEDYPKDMAGKLRIARDAAIGPRYWRVWTSQGATPALKFIVGDLPEIVEDEIDGDPVPVHVTLPVTANGRIFPREDVDIWSFEARAGQNVHCEVRAARLGSPLQARLEIRDAHGKVLAESTDRGGDPVAHFTAPADGTYQVRIHDVRFQGGQAYVYRLTITTDPHVDYFFPLGGKRGSVIKLETFGLGLPSAPVEVKLPKAAAADYVQPLMIGGRSTNRLRLELDDLPEYLESGTPVRFPGVCNGRIARPGEVDVWNFSGRKGDKLVFDLRAGRLGSALDGVIAVHDAAGKELARAETSGMQLDPTIAFTIPADGMYQMRVRDRFASRGGPEFAYRLRVTASEPPDFRLWLGADAVTLPRKGQARLRISVARLGGFKESITLAVSGLPPGVTVAPARIAAGQNVVDLQLKADATAPIKTTHLVIRGTAKTGSTVLTRTAKLSMPRGHPDLDNLLLAVALPTPFKIKGEYIMGFAPRGTLHKRRYQIERGGYAGPIEVRLADRQARHLQGVAGPTMIVPAGVNEFTYTAMLPPWMETGRTSRTCVMGIGVIQEPDGSKHEVSFSSVNQNEQLVAVVGPGRLALELDATAVSAAAGKTVSVPIHIRRGQGLAGPVLLELAAPEHMRGISALPATIAAGHESGELAIRFTAGPLGPFNTPVTVRATLIQSGQPYVAESKIEVVGK